MTALLVASTGGHLTQLKTLAPRFEGLPSERVWVTFETPQSRSMLEGEDVVFVRHVYPRDFKAIAANTRTAVQLVRSRGITAVVSTGAGVALSFLPAARAMGARCHYIESAARSTGPSVTGRILSRIPGIRLYTQYPPNVDKRWQYRGSVFDGYSAEPVPRRDDARVKRVVVTVGTIDKYGFRRLLERVRGMLGDDVEVFWQTGTSDVSGLGIEPRVSVPAAELMEAMRSADVVISHAGTGSAIAALDAGRVPIVVPRRARYDEHVDDHQEQIAAELDRRGLAIWREVDDLEPADLDRAAAARIQATAEPTPFRLQP